MVADYENSPKKFALNQAHLTYLDQNWTRILNMQSEF